jgi:hypothetical protein
MDMPQVSRNNCITWWSQSPFETEVQKKKRVKAVYFFGGGTEVPLDLFNSGKSFPNGAELRPRSHPTALFFLADVQLDNLFPERALTGSAFLDVVPKLSTQNKYCSYGNVIRFCSMRR